MEALTDSELGVKANLPVLSFNYETLMAQARAMTSKYDGLVITEEQVSEIKKDMAEINAAKKRLDSARKDVVRRINEPVKAFEEQIKQVCGVFDAAYNSLKQQVDVFVRKEREAKHVAVLAIIAEELQEAKLENPEIPVQEKWLNKTASLKFVREEIKGIIAQRLEAEEATRKAELAKQERTYAIEQAVKAANAEYETSLPVAQFITPRNLSPETSLDDITQSIINAAMVKANAQDIPAKPETDAPAGQKITEKTLSVILTYTSDNEGAVRFALNKLKSLCTSFSVRIK